MDEGVQSASPRSWPSTTRRPRTGWSSCGPGSTPGWPGCTSPRASAGSALPRELQDVVDAASSPGDAATTTRAAIGIGLGMAAPTILAFGTDEQRQRFLRPLWTGEEVWCQLFSEPGAGSDLARWPPAPSATATSWVVDGPEGVDLRRRTTPDWAILVARTDPDVPKHRGSPTSCCDMHAPGVEVRPLRQITGEAEFNEVFLTGVRLPDDLRLGEVGDGWRVAQTHAHERAGGHRRRAGPARAAAWSAWSPRPGARGPSCAPTTCTSGCCGSGWRRR